MGRSFDCVQRESPRLTVCVNRGPNFCFGQVVIFEAIGIVLFQDLNNKASSTIIFIFKVRIFWVNRK